jgi:hypothetical protein
MFCAHELFFDGTEGVVLILMFYFPGLIFVDTEGVGSQFHVLRSRTLFRRYRGRLLLFSCSAVPDSFSRYRGRRFPSSCFAHPDSYSTVARASGPVFMFYAPGLFFDSTEGIVSRFHVLCPMTHFRRYRGRRVPFSCIALPDSFSAVPRAQGPVFMFCAPSLFFRRYRVHRVPFSCFAFPDSFSAVPRASGPILLFCVPGLIFHGTEGVGSRFHVLRSRTRFRRYGGRRVPFSCFARPDSITAVPRASGPVFMFCALGLFLDGIEGIVSRFHVLLSRTHFRRYRGRRVPVSCFVLPDSFSAVSRASCPVFMFCAPGLVFGGTEGVGSRFHVLRARTRFRR